MVRGIYLINKIIGIANLEVQISVNWKEVRNVALVISPETQVQACKILQGGG